MTIRAAISGALIALIGLPASAQDDGASPKDRAQGRRVLADFAKCIADKEPEAAADYVIADDRIAQDKFDALLDPKCMLLWGGKLKMQSFYFKAALAERLIDRSTGLSQITTFDDVEQLAWPDSGDEPVEIGTSYALKLGECVVRRDPVEARNLFDTKWDSDEELAIVRTIAPKIAQCVPGGEQVRFNKSTLRAGMATSFYRLAVKQVEEGA